MIYFQLKARRTKKQLVSSIIVLLLVFFYSDITFAGPYLNSAHGNTTYGVNRSSMASLGYARANCAHCHEQHASIGGAEPAPTGGSPSPFASLPTILTIVKQQDLMSKEMTSVFTVTSMSVRYRPKTGLLTINTVIPSAVILAMTPRIFLGPLI